MPGSSSSEDDDRVEHLHFKLVLLGDQGVGKTAIAKRLASGEFNAQ
jgi:GTPase SAR1 family protein